MAIYCHGDIHGEVFEAFSYNQSPEMRKLTSEDYVIIAGDFGVIWDWHGDSEEDYYRLNWLNSKPWKTIVVLGNHECYPIYEAMPHCTPDFLNSGTMWQCTYMGTTFENIYIIDTIATLDIDGKHILCINGAESHDKKWRTEGINWWPQEVVNIDACLDFMAEHDKEHFDLIVTHEAPVLVKEMLPFLLDRYIRTCGEKYLEILRKELDFDVWVHGHMHFDQQWSEDLDSRMIGLYNVLYKV